MNEIQDSISNNESEYILNSLTQNKLRMDGRGLFDIRNIKISFEGNGIIHLLLGKTRYQKKNKKNLLKSTELVILIKIQEFDLTFNSPPFFFKNNNLPIKKVNGCDSS